MAYICKHFACLKMSLPENEKIPFESTRNLVKAKPRIFGKSSAQ